MSSYGATILGLIILMSIMQPYTSYGDQPVRDLVVDDNWGIEICLAMTADGHNRSGDRQVLEGKDGCQ